jgi:hypothetical protein
MQRLAKVVNNKFIELILGWMYTPAINLINGNKMKNNSCQGSLEIHDQETFDELYKDPDYQSFYNRTQSLLYMYNNFCVDRSDKMGSFRNVYYGTNFGEILKYMNVLSKMIGNLSELQYESPELYAKNLSTLGLENFYQVYDVLFPGAIITNLDLAVGRTIARYKNICDAVQNRLNESEKQPFGM